MTPADEVWNRAAAAWDPNHRIGLLGGDRALACLLRFHGLAMNGGVLDALENADDEMLREAIDGYRYFGFDDIAALLGGAFPQAKGTEELGLADAEELERRLDRAYTQHIPTDQTLADAFEVHYNARPDEYGPPA